MDTVILVARLVLAAVFVVAGLAKLADLAGSRQALAGFGMPARLAGPLGGLLPLAELVVAVLLLPVATAWYGSLGALVLLGLFIAGIAVTMARGEAPDCHCFGQLHSEPVGVSTLVRNVILAAIAVPIALRPSGQPSLFSWAGNLTNAELVLLIGGIVLAAAVIAEGWLLLQMLQQNGRLLLRLEALEGASGVSAEGAAPAAPAQPPAGLPVGSHAPSFTLKGLYGETMTLDALLAMGKPAMLVFSDPGCGPCNALMPDLGRWQRETSDLNIALISRGDVEGNRAKASEHGIRNVFLQEDREAAQAYLSHGTPGAVIVQPDGTIGSPLAMGAEQIRQLVSNPAVAPRPAAPQPAAVGSNGGNGLGNGQPYPVPQPGGKVGQPAPAVQLPDLGGRTVSLTDFKGRDTLVLFWNPGCGFCQRMLDDLKAWEAKRMPDAPQLLVVSTGDSERNQAQGLQSTVVLDDGFAVGRAFGASGTPSGVLVDAQGRIKSDLAVGAPGVLGLIGGTPSEQPQPAPAPAPAPAVKIGQLAPPLKLTGLNGKTVRISDYKGSNVMLLFWSPGCGFCQRMLDDLKEWEAKRGADAPQLLVISTGDPEANRAQGFKSTVVLDDGFTAGRALGASGTPSAVLIDGRGRVASELAVGADAVMTLAGTKGSRA